MRAKINKWDYFKPKTYLVKKMNEEERQTTEQEKIFTYNILIKVIVKTYKDFIELSKKNLAQ